VTSRRDEEEPVSNSGPTGDPIASMRERIVGDRRAIDARIDELSVRARHAFRLPLAAASRATRLSMIAAAVLALSGFVAYRRRRRPSVRGPRALADERRSRGSAESPATRRLPWLPFAELGVMAALELARRRAARAEPVRPWRQVASGR